MEPVVKSNHVAPAGLVGTEDTSDSTSSINSGANPIKLLQRPNSRDNLNLEEGNANAASNLTSSPQTELILTESDVISPKPSFQSEPSTLPSSTSSSGHLSPTLSTNESESFESQIGFLKLEEEIPEPVVDPTIITALSNPRDRFLLLRAEVEIERFLSDSTTTRLPLSPPYFPPLLNSYQRLLIHRLADSYGVKREVEPSAGWSTASGGGGGNITPGVVVLVKGETFKFPATKLGMLVPAPVVIPLTTAPTPSTSVLPIINPPRISLPPSTSISPNVEVPPQQPQQYFKILPRSQTPSTASQNSDKGKEKSKRDLTLEERELSYRAARERIFKSNGEEEVSGAGGSENGSNYSRSSVPSQRPIPYPQYSAPPPANGMYYPQQQQQQQPPTHLRPSAPAFSPSPNTQPASWSTYSSTTTYHNGDFTSQYGVTYSSSSLNNVDPNYRPITQPPIQLFPPPPPTAYNYYPTPSPALSTTSSSSSSRNFTSQSPTTSLGGGGYLMRFPEGGTIWPKGEGSVTSGISERTASSQNLRNSFGNSSIDGSMLGGQDGSVGGGGGGRKTHSTSTSLSGKTSTSSGSNAGGDVRSVNNVGSKRNSIRSEGSGSSVAGSESGKSGKGKLRDLGSSGSNKESSGTRLHPSLPAKPSWTILPTPSNLNSNTNSNQIPFPIVAPPPPPSTFPRQAGYSTITPAWHSLPIQPLEQYSTFPSSPSPTSDYYSNSNYSPSVLSNNGSGSRVEEGERRRPTPRSTELFNPNSGGRGSSGTNSRDELVGSPDNGR